MLTLEHFEIFSKYKDSGAHAFKKNIVSSMDKDRYADIHKSLKEAAEFGASLGRELSFWNSRFYRDGGVQGNRPKDLWSAIINADSDLLGKYPQVYVIASELGLEIGFSIAIHERDYYNEDIKIKNRAIVPILYRMLPNFDSAIIKTLQEGLNKNGSNWFFGEKSRQGLKGDFDNLTDLVRHIKSGKASEKGGGSVYKIISPSEVIKPNFRLQDEVKTMIELFSQIMYSLKPLEDDKAFLLTKHALSDAHAKVTAEDFSEETDRKTYKFGKIANRLGQRKFREKLLEVYGGTCAVTGCTEISVLQAAHITPYNGPKTNHVQNGLLLRADVHNLFDLGLISIDPESMRIHVSPRVEDLIYRSLDGNLVRLPNNKNHRPSHTNLNDQYKNYLK